MDVSKYKKMLKRAENVQRHFSSANEAARAGDFSQMKKAFKKAKNLRRNPIQEYEENPFRARFPSACPGCGQRIVEDADVEWLNKYGDFKDPEKEKWVIHLDDSCYKMAQRVIPPRCPDHGVMSLRFGQYGAYWQCSAKVGGGYCNAKPPRGQGSWTPPRPVKGGEPVGLGSPKKIMESKYEQKCRACKEIISVGENVVPWKNNDAGIWVHEGCFDAEILARSDNVCLVCREPIQEGDPIIVWRDIKDIWTHERCRDGEIQIEIPEKFKPENFKASEHQQAIKDAYLNSKKHIIIDAKAGSGKTTTLEWLINTTYSHPPKRIVMMAFNRSIAKELNSRMRAIPGVEASTLNSYGYRLLLQAYGRPKKISSTKIKELAQRPGIGPDRKGFPFKKEDQHRLGLAGEELKAKVARNRSMVGLFQKVIEKIKSNLASPDQYEEIIERYKIPVEELSDEDQQIFFQTIPELLEADIQAAVDNDIVDFDDQIWLPVVGLVRTPVPILRPSAMALLKKVKFPKDIDVLFVDEAQDLNRCQQELAIRTIGEKGRLIAVGDPFQSIYAFSGADSISMKRLNAMLSATSRGCEIKDLSVTFRCPKAVVREAQEVLQTVIPAGIPVISPDQATIEPASYAPEGVVQSLPEDLVFDSFTIEKDAILRGETVPTMVLCRTNAPLFGAALRLIGKGTPAKIVGRDISKALLDYIDEVNPKKNTSLDRFNKALEARLKKIEESERELIERGELEEGDEMSSPFQQEKDQAAAIQIVALSPSLSSEDSTVESLKKELDQLFNGGYCPKERLHEPDKKGAHIPYIADAGDKYCEVCLKERDEPVEIIKREGVIFSTVHKSKGLEALKIYILDPDRLGNPRPTASEEDQRQEIHLHYVAVTRTKFKKGDPDSGILTYLEEVSPSFAGPGEVPAEIVPPAPPISEPPMIEEPEEIFEEEMPPAPPIVLPPPAPPAIDQRRRPAFRFWIDEAMSLPYTYPEDHKKAGEQVSFPYTEQGRERAAMFLSLNQEDVAAGLDVKVYCSPSPSLPLETESSRERPGLPARPEETPSFGGSSVKTVEEIKKISLPKMPTTGKGEFSEPTITDFQTIKAMYLVKGIPAKIVKLPGWYQYALIVNGVACASTTINLGSTVARGVGKKALKVMQPDASGRFIDRAGPTIKRTGGWQGRIVERINEILLSKSPTEQEAAAFEAMKETS